MVALPSDDAESLTVLSGSFGAATGAFALCVAFSLDVSGSPSLPVHSTSFFHGIYRKHEMEEMEGT